MRSDWFFLLSTCHFLTDNSLQSADKEQQEMRAVAEKPHDAVVKFDTYRNVQRHRAVLPAIARPLLLESVISMMLQMMYNRIIYCRLCSDTNNSQSNR